MNNAAHELQHIIKATESVGNTNLIKTIQSFLSRNERTSGPFEKEEHIKVEEEKQLIIFIQNNDLFIDFSIDENRFIAAGAEQKVYQLDERFVIKLNDTIFYLSWKDYFDNLLIHNYFFPTTAYELLGFYYNDEKLFAVVKQPFIKADQATNLDNIKELLEFNGFKNKKNNDYYHPELGIVLEDLHDENVLMQNKIPFFIDTVFYILPSFYKQ